MKKIISLVALILILTIIIPAQRVQAHGPGWFLPGLIVGIPIGLSLAAPRYYNPPPAYYNPPPAYYNPPPAYYYPPPAYVAPPPSAGGVVYMYPR